MHPILAALGQISLLTSVLAETKTISTSLKSFSVTSSTVIGLPFKVICLPSDLSDAQRRIELNGKFLSSTKSRNTFPTAPVAPITAILGF